MTRTLLVLAAVAAVVLPAARPASADPVRCVVVYDSGGNPVQSVCVPGPSL